MSFRVVAIVAAVAIFAVVISVVLKNPYFAMFAGLGIAGFFVATNPIPGDPILDIPRAGDGVSWIDASTNPGVGLYSFYPNKSSDLAVWITDRADESSALGYVINLAVNGKDSYLSVLDGKGGQNKLPKTTTEDIVLNYLTTVTRTDTNSLIQVLFGPGGIFVYYVPSDKSPNANTDYTSPAFGYSTTMKYEPTDPNDVVAMPVVGVIGIESTADTDDKDDTPTIRSPQWIETSEVPSAFTLSQEGWRGAKPFDAVAFDAERWIISEGGGRISFSTIYLDTDDHQNGICVIASPDPYVPPTSGPCVLFMFFVEDDLQTITAPSTCGANPDQNLMTCEIRIQDPGDDFYTPLTSSEGGYGCSGGEMPYKFKDAEHKCYGEIDRGKKQTHFHYRSTCQFLGLPSVSEEVKMSDIETKNPEFYKAFAAANTGSGQPPAFYAKVSGSALEMGFVGDSNDEPFANYPDPDSGLVSGLKYWGIGVYPFYTSTDDETKTTASVFGVTSS